MKIITYHFNIKDSHIKKSGDLDRIIMKSVLIKNGLTRII